MRWETGLSLCPSRVRWTLCACDSVGLRSVRYSASSQVLSSLPCLSASSWMLWNVMTNRQEWGNKSFKDNFMFGDVSCIFCFVLAAPESSPCLLFQHVTADWGGNTVHHVNTGKVFGDRLGKKQQLLSHMSCVFVLSCSKWLSKENIHTLSDRRDTCSTALCVSVVLLLCVTLTEACDSLQSEAL